MVANGTTVELLSGLNRGHIGTITGAITHPETGATIYLITIPGGTRRNRTERTVRCTTVRPL